MPSFRPEEIQWDTPNQDSFYSNAGYMQNIQKPQPTAPSLYGANPYAGTGTTETKYDIPADEMRQNPETGQTEFYDVAARRWRPTLLASAAKAYGQELYMPSEQEAAFRDAQLQAQLYGIRQPAQAAPKVITQRGEGGTLQDYITQDGQLVPWGEPYSADEAGPGYKPYFQYAGTDEEGNREIFDARTGQFIKAPGGMLNPGKRATASAGERKELSGVYSLLDKTTKINDLYDPSYVGLTSGRAGRATQQLDGTEKQFREHVDSLKDDLLRAKSGAQINEQEYQRLTSFLPNYRDTNEAFQASVSRFQWELDNILKNKRRTFAETGVYFQPGQEGAQPQQAGLDANDPRVQAARAEGYTDEEIRAFLSGGR